jgi:hypothetical protein
MEVIKIDKIKSVLMDRCSQAIQTRRMIQRHKSETAAHYRNFRNWLNSAIKYRLEMGKGQNLM